MHYWKRERERERESSNLGPILPRFRDTSRHVASLHVVLTLFTLGAARLCGVMVHAAPNDTAAVGGALYAKQSDIPILIDRLAFSLLLKILVDLT